MNGCSQEHQEHFFDIQEIVAQFLWDIIMIVSTQVSRVDLVMSFFTPVIFSLPHLGTCLVPP